MALRRGTFIGAAGGALAAAAAVVPGAARADASVPFRYDSAFWMNLHHRLHAEAGIALLTRAGVRPERPTSLAMLSDRARLSPAQGSIWDAAVGIYADGGYAKRNLLFDDGLLAIKEALRGRARDAAIASNAIPHDLQRALTSAAPVYEATFWPADDAANRAWIAALQPRVEQHGAALTSRLSSVYQWPWPLGPYRVDVVRYGALFTAYTTTGPIHTVIDSTGVQRTAALETLFHEASHAVVFPDAGTVGTAIENAASLLGGKEPPDLWHALIFFTVGTVVAEQVLHADGERYVMYADANRLWDRGWGGYREALQTNWEPYLRGTATMQAALNAAVHQLVNR